MANMHTNYTDILHVKTKNCIIIFKNLRNQILAIVTLMDKTILR